MNAKRISEIAETLRDYPSGRSRAMYRGRLLKGLVKQYGNAGYDIYDEICKQAFSGKTQETNK